MVVPSSDYNFPFEYKGGGVIDKLAKTATWFGNTMSQYYAINTCILWNVINIYMHTHSVHNLRQK